MEHITNSKCIKIVIVDDDAVIPTKAHPSDIGYDITVISVCKDISEDIKLFETGLSTCPPKGYYLEILPRSSISKSGYMLANSVGVIDPSYTGTLKIALIKVDKTLPDLTMPCKICQLILRKAEYADVKLVTSIKDTDRGNGGFGSSGSY
jgi:dUTP pyrophosphatase